MKVLVAYDGSVHAKAALDDLPRAGLPRDSHVLIAAVADFSDRKPTHSEFNLLAPAAGRVDAVLEEVRRHEARVLGETRTMLADVAQTLGALNPGWTVETEVLRGEPATALLDKINAWEPDLAVGGSQGRSAVGRFLFGSVSKSAAENARCSIRIARSGPEKAAGEPLEVVLAARNPAEAERVAAAAGRRVWPDGTRIRIVAVDGGAPAVYSDGESIYETAAKSLAEICLKVSIQIENRDHKSTFMEAADAWRADAIFISPGISGSQGLDDAASALVTSGRCTVEVVR